LDRLEPGSSVLDLGCGSGKPADVEISKEHQVTGVDISQAQINLARQNVPTGHFLHGDAGSAEFPPSSFDAVVSFYTLEHIPREEHKTVLRRIYKWLRAVRTSCSVPPNTTSIRPNRGEVLGCEGHSSVRRE
jgi:cyclopropane fatty-acyl-phospholipid synthase-like methyltransferase